ncbi:8-oxo-dGTP diphosphatase MutT [Merismopedia glauca]|uniref:8-oxo-dGTP diphosphatase n=2 Tax=Merismopedia TaxID=53402 RepID=A0A2T1CA29_9CYAN|nr:8-oxo-dGTP diphosphatase MutT [Merismopedia glauca]PSB05130.1 8-oxo-dGTP diphosphatase MutT [Merismopedia glauca CCAP 1448/3]
MSQDRVSLPHKIIGVAVIWNDRAQILIDKRRQNGDLGGLWEFPGGKIEPGETVEECIAREIEEELAIEVIVGDRLITINHTYPRFHITLIVHHCHHLKGEPQPIESSELRWVKVLDLEKYAFPAANSQIIAALQQFIN